MTMNAPGDLTLRTLQRLPVLEPDAARAERVRTRCRAAVARRRKQAEHSTRRNPKTRGVEAALLGGVGMMYLVAMVYDLLRLHGIL